MIFVFGSNLSGIHGAGAAAHALDNEGAIWGQGEGLQGNSYALPTKDRNVRDPLPLMTIKAYVADFIACANAHPELQFMVTRVGCGLAGFKDDDIAPLFSQAPNNCYFDVAWQRILGHFKYYWNA